MTREEVNLKVIKYAHSLEGGFRRMPWKLYKENITELCAVQEYAKRLAMYPESDPKDILLCFRQELIAQTNLVGYENSKLYFDADCGLNRMAYFTGIDPKDSANYFEERRTHGRKIR